MKRFSFSRFQVSPVNQAAFEACRAVAELQPVNPLPVVLIGASGSGKTHLLYSVVNHVRASSEKTGLAFVTAREFPHAVFRLLTDPSPLHRAESAILLVDQLESFTEHLPELESLVALFLEQGHAVIVGTNVHPARLANLGPKLQNLLAAGTQIAIEPVAAAAETASETTSDKIALQEEALQLREELAQERKRLQAATEQCEAETRKGQTLAQELEAAFEKAATLMQEIETEQRMRKELEDEVETARARLRELEETARDAEPRAHAVDALTEANACLQSEMVQVLAELVRVKDERDALLALTANAVPTEREDALKAELESVGARKEQLEQYAEEMTRRIDALLQQVESANAYYVRGEQLQREQVAEIEAMAEQQAARMRELDAGRMQMEADFVEVARARDESEQMRRDLEEQLAAARNDARSALRSRDDALEKQDQLTASHATLEIQLEETRAQLDRQACEMDALRGGAAAQVASANAQAGEVEHKYGRLIEMVGGDSPARRDLLDGLNTLRRQLLESSETARRVAGQLNDLPVEVPPGAPGTVPEETEAALLESPDPLNGQEASRSSKERQGDDSRGSAPTMLESPAANGGNGCPAITAIDPGLLDGINRLAD